MDDSDQVLPIVTTAELSRSPGRVLERIARGERLLVCRHKRPIATLQPLDGYVLQPLTGNSHDVFGWPVGGIDEVASRLSETQRLLLLDGYRMYRLKTSVPDRTLDPGEAHRAIDDLIVRGMAERTDRGVELTARGFAIREHLLKTSARPGQPKASLVGLPPPPWADTSLRR